MELFCIISIATNGRVCYNGGGYAITNTKKEGVDMIREGIVGGSRTATITGAYESRRPCCSRRLAWQSRAHDL